MHSERERQRVTNNVNMPRRAGVNRCRVALCRIGRSVDCSAYGVIEFNLVSHPV